MRNRLTKSSVKKECRFCYPPDTDRIIYRTNNFYVMLSLVPIVEGYLLIISNHHYECCAAIDSEIMEEFCHLVGTVKKILQYEYGCAIFYEHGRSGSSLQYSTSGRHCYHAHLHCVPTKVDLGQIVENDFHPTYIKDWNNLKSIFCEQHLPYLFIDSNDKKRLFLINRKIRSQYLRFKLAEALNKEKLSDWMKFSGWRKIYAAKKRLVGCFTNLE